jgi:hypothetical protein
MHLSASTIDDAGNTSAASNTLTLIVNKATPRSNEDTLATDPTNQTSTTVQLFKRVPRRRCQRATGSSKGKTVTLDTYGSSTQKLAKRTKYTARISGARDPVGNELVGNDPSGDYVWSFKTGSR